MTKKEIKILTAKLEKCYTGVIYDVMRNLGLKDFTLPPDIRPLIPGINIAGPVFTMSGSRKKIGSHETLLEWTGFLSKAKPEHVVICQPNEEEIALMGELSAETLMSRGIRGYIVDGGCRDTNFIIRQGFPVFHKYFTPKDIVEKWSPDAYDVSISIGDVEINPGDFVLGDRDGIVIIPKEHSVEILELSEEAMQTENLVRKAILEGMDPQKAYIKYRKF